MNAKQNLIVVGGAGLIAANIWFGPAPRVPMDLGSIWPYYTDSSSGVPSSKAHSEVMIVVFALAGVWLISMLGGISDGAANAGLAFFGGLWLLWLIERASVGGAAGVFAHTTGGTQATTPGPMPTGVYVGGKGTVS